MDFHISSSSSLPRTQKDRNPWTNQVQAPLISLRLTQVPYTTIESCCQVGFSKVINCSPTEEEFGRKKNFLKKKNRSESHHKESVEISSIIYILASQLRNSFPPIPSLIIFMRFLEDQVLFLISIRLRLPPNNRRFSYLFLALLFSLIGLADAALCLLLCFRTTGENGYALNYGFQYCEVVSGDGITQR